jgi:hypothetical protein
MKKILFFILIFSQVVFAERIIERKEIDAGLRGTWVTLYESTDKGASSHEYQTMFQVYNDKIVFADGGPYNISYVRIIKDGGFVHHGVFLEQATFFIVMTDQNKEGYFMVQIIMRADNEERGRWLARKIQ